MPASFVHGVEIIESNIGPAPVTIVKSSVIGLIGTAPQWLVPSGNLYAPPGPNVPTLVSSVAQGSAFGPAVKGYTIPYALAAIQAQGKTPGSGGQVIVIDVFNPSVHNTEVIAGVFTFPASGVQVINLGHMGILGGGGSLGTTMKPVVTNSGASTTYLEGTDYIVDYINGLITQKSGGSMTTNEAVKVTFYYADPGKVEDLDIIGGITDGVYTGISALQTTFNTMGFFAKILIAPGYSKDETTAAALDAMSNLIRAVELIDSPANMLVATAISNRGSSGNTFDTSSKRAIVLPNVPVTASGIDPTGVTINSAGTAVQNQVTAGTADTPLSQWAAGVMAANDIANGYWWSPSNQQINGILGPDVTMYMNPFDPNDDPTSLNAAGICTIMSAFGTGIRFWGNRSAGYPTYTTPDVFIPVRRTFDVVEESLQLFAMQYVDAPITPGLLDTVLESGNGFIRTLIQRGAMVQGSYIGYDPADNPVANLEAGHVTFFLDGMAPTPAERITFNVYIDPSLLANILPATQAVSTDPGSPATA